MSGAVTPRWLQAPLFGWSDVAVLDVAFAVLLSAAAVSSTSGLSHPHEAHVGVAASVAVLLMTAPVALARRHPVATAGALLVGAAFNGFVVGHMIRCGATLPAVFYTAFVVGSRVGPRPRVAAAMALLAGSIAAQAVTDPRLGAGVIGFMVPISLAFMAAGRLLRGRNAAVALLRLNNAQLREQRELNAALAVAADQARIAGDLNDFLHDRVGQIAAAAALGREAVADPDRACAAFVSIQATGRDALTHMRGVVANLRDPFPTAPAPVLAQLDHLLGQATHSDARLRVAGDPRLLPPGLELSGYRIVEHLVAGLDDDPAARVEVTVTFRADELELAVSGPRTRRGSLRTALAAATERAAVHGGTLETAATGSRRTTVVRLPLAAARV